MVVKNKYVLAHTSDLSCKRFNPNQPDPLQGNNQNNNNQNNNNANNNAAPLAGANDNMNLAANEFAGGYASAQNAMSQIVSVRDNPNRFKDIKKHLLEIMKDKAQQS